MKRKIIIEKGNDCYGAFIPSLGGCTSMGDTIEQTKTNILESINDLLEWTKEDGAPLPDISDGFYFEVDMISRTEFWEQVMTDFEGEGFLSSNRQWNTYSHAYSGNSAGIRPSINTSNGSRDFHYKIILKQSGQDKHVRLELCFGGNNKRRNKRIYDCLYASRRQFAGVVNIDWQNSNPRAIEFARFAFDGEDKAQWQPIIKKLITTTKKFDKTICGLRRLKEELPQAKAA